LCNENYQYLGKCCIGSKRRHVIQVIVITAPEISEHFMHSLMWIGGPMSFIHTSFKTSISG
ncbi:hypothetical protein, partial [Methanolobus chelungpuianus]|uniref:hypothetical protein n=1 Tax=Methanolobus chelungpuianus TaxID=502115 RepID=UPI002114AD78